MQRSHGTQMDKLLNELITRIEGEKGGAKPKPKTTPTPSGE